MFYFEISNKYVLNHSVKTISERKETLHKKLKIKPMDKHEQQPNQHTKLFKTKSTIFSANEHKYKKQKIKKNKTKKIHKIHVQGCMKQLSTHIEFCRKH